MENKTFTYRTQGTCSQLITISLAADGTIYDVRFLGGCNGNLQGISSLVRGMTPDAVIERLSGIKCGSKPTRCPDQLCKALQQIKSE